MVLFGYLVLTAMAALLIWGLSVEIKDIRKEWRQ